MVSFERLDEKHRVIDPVVEDDELRNYTLAKQRVTNVVRAAKGLFSTLGGSEQEGQSHELLVKLAEDRFNLAVVGQFKRGKSSLMNAIIGHDLLPTGLLPLTSVITALCYGPEPHVWLRHHDWSLRHDIELSELVDYVTERGNPGNKKKVKEAYIEWPTPFLRRGLYFVDTPGIGSAIAANTATTYAYLPEVDAVIFVTSVEAPLSEAEQVFLRDIRDHVRKLFIVVNKTDLLAENEYEEVFTFIRRGLEEILNRDDFRLYPISARYGLEGKQNDDYGRVERSGLPELEAELAVFLSQERARTFLVSILDRMLRIFDDYSAQFAGMTSPPAPHDQETTLDDLRAQIVDLREHLLKGGALEIQGDDNAAPVTSPQLLERAIEVHRPSEEQQNPHALLRTGTCPLCAAASQAVLDFFAQWQYTLATSKPAQREFAGVRGFCHFHTWQFERISSPQDISEGYVPLIDATDAELKEALAHEADDMVVHIQALLAGKSTCPACRVLGETAYQQLRLLFSQLDNTEGQRVYAESAGLCLPHLHQALLAAPSDDLRRWLLREQIQRLEEIAEDMRSYTLKREALRRNLWNKREENAWRRALVQLTGERTVRDL